MDKKTGIVGLTGSFREAVADLPEGSRVVFTGSAAVCTPFIELLSYSIRDKGFEMVFIPNAVSSEARKIKKQKNIGMSVVDEAADPKDPDVVVVMGGLAMSMIFFFSFSISSCFSTRDIFISSFAAATFFLSSGERCSIISFINIFSIHGFQEAVSLVL